MNNSEHGEPDRSGTSLPVRFIATGFFSGYLPWASGTFGSVVGALFFLIPGFANPIILAAAIVATGLAGVFTSTRVAASVGNQLTKTAERLKERFQPERHDTPDPSIVVIDEIVGMWVAMFALHLSLPAVVLAFFSFRFFDIIKPYPARQVERIGSGWGIMLDDVVAGIYANIVTRIALALLYQYVPGIF